MLSASQCTPSIIPEPPTVPCDQACKIPLISSERQVRNSCQLLNHKADYVCDIKDIMVVETDWPAVCSGVTMSERSIAISAAGQSTWVAGIRDALSSIGSRGIGIVYWEPAWIGNAGLGSACSVSCVKDYTQVVSLRHWDSYVVLSCRMRCLLMGQVILAVASTCSPQVCRSYPPLERTSIRNLIYSGRTNPRPCALNYTVTMTGDCAVWQLLCGICT